MKNLSSEANGPERITLLAVSDVAEDLHSLSEILKSSPCQIRNARNCREAAEALSTVAPTVIACERDLPDGSWKDLISLLGSVSPPPPVIVMARHADERLWAEVLNLGGYDVLSKPLDGTEVSRVLAGARRHGRATQVA